MGFWGVSMGQRDRRAVHRGRPEDHRCRFGLAGHETLAEASARITIQVEFLLQWDDEVVPRESGLALFGAFASREKTLHANPGHHVVVPRFEMESSERFSTCHLLEGGASGGGCRAERPSRRVLMLPGVEKRTILRHSPGQTPIPVSGR